MSVRLFQGDCLEVMATLPENSISSIVTDPPYGLSFMGKHWDHGVPGVAFWEAALRVAKPGAMLLAFGGTRTFHRLTVAIEDAGWEIRDCLTWLYGQGFPKSHNLGNGWGTALKPAWEPIIMAMKPLDGTFANNALVHGVAGLNIDGCRINGGSRPHIERRNDKALDGDVYGSGINGSRSLGETTQGRWPANLILDEESAAMLDEMSGISKSTERSGHPGGHTFGGGKMGENVNGVWYGDQGGASRFFYCAKASRADRGEGNTHPTVKPEALCRYLVRLVTPSGGTVLDPFMGSGSTGKAAVLEGFNFTGIDTEAEYLAIAERRIAHAQAQAEKPTQTQPALLEVA